WFEQVDQGWNEQTGAYAPWDAESSATINAAMLPGLTVMGLDGDSKRAARIPRIIEKLVATPPWDPEYHYWNMRLDAMGMEPHAGSCAIGGQLAMVYMFRRELGLPSDLMEKAMDQVALMTAKRADMARHAGEVPVNCYTDAEGNAVDAWALKCEAVRTGVPVDLRWLREVGPSNQPIDMWASAMAYLATGRPSFWEHTRLIWGRLAEKEENGRQHMYRCCMDPDYSFVYSQQKTEHGSNTHRYTQSAYALHLMYEQGNAVRIARKLGQRETVWEETLRTCAESLFGRMMLRDGTLNMVFNSYGWERSTAGTFVRTYYLHPMIPLADLTPFTPGQIVRMVSDAFKTSREWCQTGHANFPPALGLKGFHRSGGQYIAWVCASQLAEIILTNPEAMEKDEDAERPSGCYSGFAWEQKHFVMQTPTFSMTVVGAGAPRRLENGYLGLGMVVSGGEYVLKLQDGDYLTPMSDAGRALMSTRVAGEELLSSQVDFYNREDYGFTMDVILPDGTRISRGEDFGSSPYDPDLENLSLEISFGRNQVRLTRRFDFSATDMIISDTIRALDDIAVDHFFSRLPVITVGPQGQTVSIMGRASGRALTIKPPCHMGYDGDIQHYDQDFIQSVTDLEWLQITYPSGCGFTFERLDSAPIRPKISRGEWQENRLMRVDGKNIDFYWISEPTHLSKGETRTFSYRITPLVALEGQTDDRCARSEE
ncbi:MAG: hypothetical protein V1800_03930, partial [Candidatus Latescibacterota bacterium]